MAPVSEMMTTPQQRESQRIVSYAWQCRPPQHFVCGAHIVFSIV